MKRITAFFLSCVLILSLVGNVYAISDQNEDVIAVKNTVEEFLSKATRKVYFYEPQDTAILTTKTLLQEFTFSSAGTWRIEVSSPGLTTFTYTVRIVDQ